MKTAVSIPDDVFEAAEELARRMNASRSQLYATALRALLANDSEVTERLNRIYTNEPADPAIISVGRRVLASSDW
jgi:metal-responsive CopG/Arc/MetJ family transcriptional regulator